MKKPVIVGLLGAMALAVGFGVASQGAPIARLRASAELGAPGSEAHWLKAVETGYPPLGKSGPEAQAVARENARNRAKAHLLRLVLATRLHNGKSIEEAVRGKPEHKARLKALINGAQASQKELAGDLVEYTMAIPLEGEDGLNRFLADLEAR